VLANIHGGAAARVDLEQHRTVVRVRERRCDRRVELCRGVLAGGDHTEDEVALWQLEAWSRVVNPPRAHRVRVGDSLEDHVDRAVEAHTE